MAALCAHALTAGSAGSLAIGASERRGRRGGAHAADAACEQARAKARARGLEGGKEAAAQERGVPY